MIEACEVHYHLMPDGRCSCPNICKRCGTRYEGYNHTVEQCRDALSSIVPTESRPALQKFRAALTALYLEVEPSIAANIGILANCALIEAESASSFLLPVPRQIQIQCEMCDGTGQMHVTHDMAIDAGNLNLSGQLISCGTCGGDGFKIEQAEPNENENLASLPVGESTPKTK